MKKIKLISLLALVISSMTLTGCGLKVSMNGTNDAACVWLCS